VPAPNTGAPGEAPSPKPVPNEKTVAVLRDLAVKRHDLAERAFDTLNTRLGALFAFNSFLLPAFRSVVDHGGRGCASWAAVIVSGCAFLTVAIATFIGFRARSMKTLPNPVSLYVSFGSKSPEHADAQVIAQLDEAWKAIDKATKTKGTCLNVSLVAVGLEVVALVVLAAVQLLR
jgi:hypothetical protein